ncbi:hypothetical protein KAI87_14300 [Myxococcota bacterium]|nr:hypothetical protein [Myxococcota bacterium]
MTATADPKTLGVIDIGSNAVRLQIVHLCPLSRVRDGYYERHALRLGADVFADGEISSASAQELIRILHKFADELKTRGCDIYRAVATSAMRDAKNSTELVEVISKEVGISIDIIEGTEESQLSHEALLGALGDVSDDSLAIDLGGGSLELQPLFADVGDSLPFGTVRLLELFPKSRLPMSEEDVEILGKQITEGLREAVTEPFTSPLAAATGGNFDALSRLLPKPAGQMAGVNLAVLPAFARSLAGMDQSTRQKELRLRADRADVILPAVLVLRSLVDIFKIRRIIVPGTGLRAGVLRSLVRHNPEEKRLKLLVQELGVKSTETDLLFQRQEEVWRALSPLHDFWCPSLLLAKIVALFRHHQKTPDALKSSAQALLSARDLRSLDSLLRVLEGETPEGLSEGYESGALHDLALLIKLSHALLSADVKVPVRLDLLNSPPLLFLPRGHLLSDTLREEIQKAFGVEVKSDEKI